MAQGCLDPLDALRGPWGHSGQLWGGLDDHLGPCWVGKLSPKSPGQTLPRPITLTLTLTLALTLALALTLSPTLTLTKAAAERKAANPTADPRSIANTK